MQIKIPKFHFDRDPYAYEPEPGRAWGILLLVFLLLLILLGLMSFYIYRSLESAALSEQDRIVPASQTIDKDELKKVTDFYASKKVEFETFVSSPSNISDPSI
ncbi:MAG TPA: hypothetical protein VJJ24_01715 [Candidatus Paceibacterota bacterium]